MKLRVLLVPAVAAMFVLGACGDDSGSGSSAATTVGSGSASTAAPAAAGGGGYAIPSDATATSAASSGGSSGGGATAADTVVAKSIAYNPDKITVKVGDTVTFKNDDSFAHTFTADNGEFDSNNVDGGGSFQFTTDKAGTIAFHCKIHSNMHGTITVES
jgi:plastocyanin